MPSRYASCGSNLRAMLGVGEAIPDATVWTAPRRSATLPELLGGRPALVLFYLFDWSAT